jgi:hypothetical protein
VRATWLWGMAQEHFFGGYAPGTFQYPWGNGNYRNLGNEQGSVPPYNNPVPPKPSGVNGTVTAAAFSSPFNTYGFSLAEDDSDPTPAGGSLTGSHKVNGYPLTSFFWGKEGSLYLVNVALKPTGASPPPQSAFTTLKYTDRTSVVHTLDSSAADYEIAADNSVLWVWSVGGVSDIPDESAGATTPLVVT